MSRDLAYADQAAADIHAVSAANVAHLSSLYAMPVSVRRENLLSLAEWVYAAGRVTPVPDVEAAVRYYSLTTDPMPAWGRLLRAVRDCDAVETDKALTRLVGAE